MGSPLGQNIYKALAMSELELKLYMLDVYAFSEGLLWDGQPVVCTFANANSFIEEWIAFLKRERIQMVFFGTEAEPRALMPHLERLRQETSTQFLLNSPECLVIAEDKLLTANHLRAAGLNAPASADATDIAQVEALLEEMGFPLIIKPRKGSAARGFEAVKNRNQLQQLLAPGYVLQELLLPADQEYTVGVYRCKDGRIASVTTIHRELNFGLTYKGILVDHPEIEDYAKSVVLALDGFGPINVQLKLTSRGPVAFEVNPRLSSTAPIRAHFGVNEPEMAIREYVLGENLPQIRARTGGVLRYWSEHYLEKDELNSVLQRDTSFWKSGS
jgi:carbamoyl-phosphate synthase large subunit